MRAHTCIHVLPHTYIFCTVKDRTPLDPRGSLPSLVHQVQAPTGPRMPSAHLGRHPALLAVKPFSSTKCCFPRPRGLRPRRGTTCPGFFGFVKAQLEPLQEGVCEDLRLLAGREHLDQGLLQLIAYLIPRLKAVSLGTAVGLRLKSTTNMPFASSTMRGRWPRARACARAC